ncbi:uncharacterized protein LOC110113289 isoform X1 [Dendrobium catenatum]|uniref:uncharacterized protein LOC110113289 isoform X1 n=1 Tax=Dendrobium catenatum TaxID=906689 RepID=UPI0010A09652|nr:uncharacterized protein LOC110113289 isoform X1 [Dendrobium catenatum]
MAVSFCSRFNLGGLYSLPSSLTSFRYLKYPLRLRFSCSAIVSSRYHRLYTTVMIVPTGVGAAIGGYAGDALPVARTLASVADCVISHPNMLSMLLERWNHPDVLNRHKQTPLMLAAMRGKIACVEKLLQAGANVLNAAMLYWPMPNTLYVEGYALDRFAEGLWALQPVHLNTVGLILDAGMEEELQIRHLQVADASRASLGLPVLGYIVTDTPLEVEKWINLKTGQSTGRIKNPDSLLRAVDVLVSQSHVNAVAVVGRFPDDLEEMDDYRQGKGIDSLAGVEAVISHLIVERFQIPCAHAPAILPAPLCSSLSPRSAAEEVSREIILVFSHYALTY